MKIKLLRKVKKSLKHFDVYVTEITEKGHKNNYKDKKENKKLNKFYNCI